MNAVTLKRIAVIAAAAAILAYAHLAAAANPSPLGSGGGAPLAGAPHMDFVGQGQFDPILVTGHLGITELAGGTAGGVPVRESLR